MPENIHRIRTILKIVDREDQTHESHYTYRHTYTRILTYIHTFIHTYGQSTTESKRDEL